MNQAEPNRFWARADLTCCLRMANGGTSPDTRTRSWHFEMPVGAHTLEHWQELLYRIVYDTNVGLRRREPGDAAWIDVEGFTVTRIDPASILEWNGNTAEAMPWIELDRSRIWEPAVCFYVNEVGRYDVMTGSDFTELLLYRLVNAGFINSSQFIDFLNRLFSAREPEAGVRIFANARERFANLTVVRELAGVFRKTPGAGPIACGPVLPQHL
ncbi:MAG: hypothetical protein K1Y36_19940 [Blastocatellia bacterium]|nr:hypothetical protein [Blastocatellia bacterium]